MSVGGGGVKLYHSVWKPLIMCLARKIVRSLGCYVDNESIPLKIIFISVLKASSSGTSANPCFPLSRAYLFTFIVESSSSYQNTSWRALLSFISFVFSWCWVWVWLDLFCHELQCLVSTWSLEVLCIYVLRSRKGLARYHFVILYHDYFGKVLSSEISYYCSLVCYVIDISKCET